MCKIDDHCKFNAWSRAPKAGGLEQLRGIEWGRRCEWGAGSGGHMSTCGQCMLMYGKNHHTIVK